MHDVSSHMVKYLKRDKMIRSSHEITEKKQAKQGKKKRIKNNETNIKTNGNKQNATHILDVLSII